MVISELINALAVMKEKHGDIEVGYCSNPGASSFEDIQDLSYVDANAWSKAWETRSYNPRPRLPERWVIDMYNGNPG